MISIEGLQQFADRLLRLDVERTEAAALKEAALGLAESINAAAAAPPGECGLRQRGYQTRASTIATYCIDEHAAVVGLRNLEAIETEIGSTTVRPLPT